MKLTANLRERPKPQVKGSKEKFKQTGSGGFNSSYSFTKPVKFSTK